MKVIFLDIDGVLNSSNYWRTELGSASMYGMRASPTSHEAWDPACVKRIQHLIKVTDAKVVVSSTWRGNWEKCKDHLAKANITPVIDKTKMLGHVKGRTRGMEIQDWLDNHHVDNYVIIDDDSDMLDSQKDHFVQTTWADGFQDQHLKQAINILFGGTSEQGVAEY